MADKKRKQALQNLKSELEKGGKEFLEQLSEAAGDGFASSEENAKIEKLEKEMEINGGLCEICGCLLPCGCED